MKIYVFGDLNDAIYSLSLPLPSTSSFSFHFFSSLSIAWFSLLHADLTVTEAYPCVDPQKICQKFKGFSLSFRKYAGLAMIETCGHT